MLDTLLLGWLDVESTLLDVEVLYVAVLVEGE